MAAPCLFALLCIPVFVGAAPPAGNSPEASAAGGPYGRWSHGPSTSADFFPIGVWLQSPNHIAEFKRIGINMFVGFWGELDEARLTKFADHQMPLIPAQNLAGLKSSQNHAITGWDQPDEPDNAQPNGILGHGPCLTPDQIVALYNAIRASDTTRPVVLNLGRGVADTSWTGRGSCTGQTTGYYPRAVAGGDIISFDIYPVAAYQGRLELVATGLDNLKTWIGMSGASKLIWNAVEAVPVAGGAVPTPLQVRAEVWMSIIHGSQGIVYFVHQFSHSERKLIREDGIFNFPVLVDAVAAINTRITALAPVLNSPNVGDGVSVSTSPTTPVSTMVKQYQGATYLFAVAMRDVATAATFELPTRPSGVAQVLDENRQIDIFQGRFRDDFAGYGVHLYKITIRQEGR